MPSLIVKPVDQLINVLKMQSKKLRINVEYLTFILLQLISVFHVDMAAFIVLKKVIVLNVRVVCTWTKIMNTAAISLLTTKIVQLGTIKIMEFVQCVKMDVKNAENGISVKIAKMDSILLEGITLVSM